jgi:hypothetical protein
MFVIAVLIVVSAQLISSRRKKTALPK